MGAYRNFVAWLGHGRWFGVMLRQLGGSRADRWLYRHFNGRLAITGPPIFPVLLLTTTGRRSGRPRTTPVIYVRDGERLVVSSEQTGQQRPAAWPLNLHAEPRVSVRLGAESAAYRGRPAAPDEVERYWPALLEAWPAHATYRARSGVRHIFVLEPARA
ncbi:MAG TPA: nitroreductase/quinone reductase family protein [Solirubrobacteraceae bacterium]|jgi:deazaflavin-dependent oxidoreductase (nitroreductase family)